MRPSRVVLLFLIGVFVTQIFYYYPNLPETVASHFNGFGEPDRFASKQSFVLLEGVILMLIVFEFTLLPLLIEKMPDFLLNLPNKDFWLAKERRGETFLTIRRSFEWFSIMLLGLFIAVNQLVFIANINRENLPPVKMWLVIGAFLFFVALWLINFMRRFRIKNV
jgi:uncharacterized membrane protein